VWFPIRQKVGNVPSGTIRRWFAACPSKTGAPFGKQYTVRIPYCKDMCCVETHENPDIARDAACLGVHSFSHLFLQALQQMQRRAEDKFITTCPLCMDAQTRMAAMEYFIRVYSSLREVPLVETQRGEMMLYELNGVPLAGQNAAIKNR
jgi:hypothetical protein